VNPAQHKGVIVQRIGLTGLVYLALGAVLINIPVLWGFGILLVYFGASFIICGVIAAREARPNKNEGGS
jgi:hypothetical protein